MSSPPAAPVVAVTLASVRFFTLLFHLNSWNECIHLLFSSKGEGFVHCGNTASERCTRFHLLHLPLAPSQKSGRLFYVRATESAGSRKIAPVDADLRLQCWNSSARSFHPQRVCESSNMRRKNGQRHEGRIDLREKSRGGSRSYLLHQGAGTEAEGSRRTGRGQKRGTRKTTICRGMDRAMTSSIDRRTNRSRVCFSRKVRTSQEFGWRRRRSQNDYVRRCN